MLQQLFLALLAAAASGQSTGTPGGALLFGGTPVLFGASAIVFA